MDKKMPVLFAGHGSPMNIAARNGYTADMAKWGQSLPKPEAILVVSAHWQSMGTQVCLAERPETVYDFYGFPSELYQVKYPCAGAPAVGRRIREVLGADQILADEKWGLDHGAWAVLHHMYPKADVPVLQLSLDRRKSPEDHYHLGSQLKFLREEGVLVLASGNLVHNLARADFHNMDARPYDWAEEFDQSMKKLLLAKDHDALIHYDKLPGGMLAAPTEEHYIPMLYVLAMAEPDENVIFTHETIQNGSVSMRCFQIGG